MKILLFLPNAFEHMESSIFIDVFGWARNDFGQDIDVETCGFTREVNSTFGVPVIVRHLIHEIAAEQYDALALPGGFQEFGYYEEAFQEPLLQLIRDFHNQGKPIASVCVAALVLGQSGILKGKRATTYHLKENDRLSMLADYGALTLRERIVVDNRIITSCGPETAVWVAFRLLEMLTSANTAGKVREAMGYLFTIDKNGNSVY